MFIDYFLEVPQNNNGHEAPILLARHNFSGSASAPFDTVNGTVSILLSPQVHSATADG
jgi:hypothetical protein